MLRRESNQFILTDMFPFRTATGHLYMYHEQSKVYIIDSFVYFTNLNPSGVYWFMIHNAHVFNDILRHGCIVNLIIFLFSQKRNF